MTRLKKNIIANYMGNGLTSIMGIIFIPWYIKYLGMESYGLIGIFGIMQTCVSRLDMGLKPTLSRETAKFIAGDHTAQSILNLLRTLEFIFLGLAFTIVLLVSVLSDQIAHNWLSVGALSLDTVAWALKIMAFVVALRFCEGLYSSALAGLQEQVLYNFIFSVFASIRHIGALLILMWYSPTIQAFFLWQGFVSLLSLVVFSFFVYRLLPNPPASPVFSLTELKKVWRFAGGMMTITLLALLLTNIDKLLLSKLLTLENFGYYTLAYTVASTLSMITSPVTQATQPRLVELFILGDPKPIAETYHRIAQFLTVFCAPAALILFIYGKGVLIMWSGSIELSEKVAPILSLLVVGFFLNAQMTLPYICQTAFGWTSLAVKTNLVSVLIIFPLLIKVVPLYGAMGAAAVWVALNAGYVFISVPIMHRKILKGEKWQWYLKDILIPTLGSFAIMALAMGYQPDVSDSRPAWFAFLALTGVLSLFCAMLFAPEIRKRFLSFIFSFKGSKNEI